MHWQHLTDSYYSYEEAYEPDEMESIELLKDY